MVWPPEELKKVADRVHSGASEHHTVRQLLRWYGYERRGRFIVWAIRRDFTNLKLHTEPDFEYAYLDGELAFQILSDQVPPQTPSNPEAEEAQAILITSEPEDPTQRIGRLPSANTRPVSVNPNATVAEAVTLMLLYDYSQLPVMQGERTLKGVITWQSIGTRLALRRPCVSVQDALEDAVVIESGVSLFSAIPAIVERGFVLVRDATNTISGIVTTTDLSLQFRQLAEPFLLLEEIEKHLRRLSDGKFSAGELEAAKDPNDESREIGDLSDLTFGEHIRLLENPERWSALKLNIDRGTFVKHLNEVRDIRNDIMHFDPDGTAPSELEKLRQFVRLLDALGTQITG
ncbi:MAG TPA: CBS domain-containing protein [Pyrinomonadaceae bacterium]|nr:CBS domain-containing protein [Pyrinomonadaceae bacterium]